MNKDKEYPHIQAIFDAMEINTPDVVEELLDKFVNLLGTIGMSMEVLEDDEIKFIDKQKLQLVINITIERLDDVMNKIILESSNE